MYIIHSHARFTISAADGETESGLHATEPLLCGLLLVSRALGEFHEEKCKMADPLNLAEYAPGACILVPGL